MSRAAEAAERRNKSSSVYKQWLAAIASSLRSRMLLGAASVVTILRLTVRIHFTTHEYITHRPT